VAPLFIVPRPRPARPGLDKALYNRHKDYMRTLTITDAKKNLGRWLKAAAQGQEIAIVAGADIIALRKVEVAALDTSYAETEYGATPESLAHLESGVAARYRRQRKAGKLRSLAQVEAVLEKANAH